MEFFYLLIKVVMNFCAPLWIEYFFYPIIGLAFLASVPRLARLFVTWR